ncbi:chorismate mutase family protein [Streptomyces platensis]|uniref:chorismate mutase family protein n=1 Tax=Streptomyces platensis TaxID=58346 RepID=UPI0033E2F0F3
MTHEQHAAPRSSEGLEALRTELDATDARLRDALRERIEICVRIALHKREHDIPMMQPHRIGMVQERAARFAAENQIDQTFIRRFYELIIDETCRVEDLVIAGEDAT